MQVLLTIENSPTLRPAEDYHLLRKKGIEYIEQMGSRWWTDYNAHDPGITLLEALCYAITELGYRTGWEMKDLLAQPPLSPPLGNQPFFTAREVLTCNPLTINDFRKILIDLEGIRNAWLVCKDCPCEAPLHADCEGSQLAFEPPPSPKKTVPVTPLGAYDIMLELDQDAELGDLNDRKVYYEFTYFLDLPGTNSDSLKKLTIEARFPSWNATANGPFQHRDSLNKLDFDFDEGKISDIFILKLSRSKTDPNIVTDDELQRKRNEVFFTSFEVHFSGGASQTPILLENVALRFHGSDEARFKLKVQEDVIPLLSDKSANGIVARFIKKEKRVALAVEEAKLALHKVRNLCEDFCCTDRVCVEDVAVCADIELRPDADIERVLAEVLFQIEDYFNPPVPFYSLKELQAEGMPMEEIFDGPQLGHGFLKTTELEAAGLKTMLRTSDIINRLVDIEGVVAVKNLLLTKYDAEGNPVKGAADGGAVPSQMSARWTLAISDRCQPRLYAALSKFMFFKNELPFLARMDEVEDTLTVLRGNAERPKIKAAEMDLPVPIGTFRQPQDYFPVQYSLPLTYGIGEAGLPERATPLRRAQAKQLKAYLLFFEQLLANYLAQLANVGKLFSLDPAIAQTYFTKDLRDDNFIRGSEDLILNTLTPAKLQGLAESDTEFLDRRNRFLDHLLGRFAESFSDYALALFSFQNNASLNQQTLIEDKIAFLRDYPVLSRERAKALDYRQDPGLTNFPGLRRRIARLLGFDLPTEEQILLVEHFILRPKFYGDALMGVCLDKDCKSCGDEDPYSFQMTVVMPGWQAPFDTNLEMRRFADQTIKQETPAHILVKICWVGNRGYEFDPCDPAVVLLAQWLTENTLTADNKRPTLVQACACTEAIFKLYDVPFQAWLTPRLTDHHLPDTVKAALKAVFDDAIKPADLKAIAGCDLVLPPHLGSINAFMMAHFTGIAINGRQYDKFVKAWEAWLAANKPFDWCERGLHGQVEALLDKHVVNNKGERLWEVGCDCEVLARFGTAFHERQRQLFAEGGEIPTGEKAKAELEAIFGTAFGQGLPCANVNAGAPAWLALRELLTTAYLDYFTVSQKLWLLLDLLGKLTTVYPAATLHDCDDGSDLNPVRLGRTALGGG